MKRVQIPTSTVDGSPASPQIRLTDIEKIGEFSRDALGEFIRDIMGKPSSTYIVMGGQYALAAGLQVDVFPPLAIYRTADGRIFSLYSETQITLTHDAADATNPRLDLIVATLHEDDGQNSNLRHFRKNPPNPGQPEGDTNVADEVWDHMTLSIIKGTAALNPVAPAIPSGGVLLYTVTITPTATGLTDSLVADNRRVVETQERQDEEIDALQADVNTLKQFKLPISATQVRIEAGAGIYSGLTDQDAWAMLANQSDEQDYDPITRPETLTANGKVGGIPNQDGTTPVVDIPLGVEVAFSNVIRKITQNSIPAELNPHIVNLSGSAGTDTDTKDTSPLTIGSLVSIESDGGGAWTPRLATCPSKRLLAAAAARDSRYIEVFGGQNGVGGNPSDWFTYDTLSDAVTPRTLTGAATPPASTRPTMFSCGDDRHLLLAVTFNGVSNARWFLIDTVDFSCVEKSGPTAFTGGGGPQPYQRFVGDLVQANIIVFAAIANDGVSNAPAQIQTYWKYDVAAGTFTQLNVTGSLPTGNVTGTDACLYQQGKLVLFENDPVNLASGKTFVFDYATLSWTRLNINQPYNVFSSLQAPITGFRMVNIGGKPQIFGGTDAVSGSQTGFWILTPGTTPEWNSFTPGGHPWVFFPGGASLISAGLPKGSGFSFAGQDLATQGVTDKIYSFGQGGIIETTFGGVTGITLAPGTRQAVIRIQDYQVNLAGVVAKVFLSLAGSVPPGSVAISMSLDDGLNFQAISRDKVQAVTNSSNPAKRQLKLTLFSLGSSAPIITGIHEVFEKTGGPSFSQAYIRFTVPAGTKALYMNRDGSMEMVTAVNPTVPDKGILIKTTHNGTGVNPSVKNYVNMRRILVEYEAAKGGGTPQFDYDGAVAPKFTRATGTTGGATGAVYRIAKPTIDFDAAVSVSGLAASSDWYHVEAEA